MGYVWDRGARLGLRAGLRFHDKQAVQGAEEFTAAGWGYGADTIFNLPLGSSRGPDLINIYTVPFYHVNANDTHQRRSSCSQARMWGAGPLWGVRLWPCDLGEPITAAQPGSQSLAPL